MSGDPYRAALTDWLACAAGGIGERAPRALLAAGTGLLDVVACAGAAGHVLDFDDTFADGIAHVSAAVAPAALGVTVSVGGTLGEALAAFAEGFEAMAAFADASHPALYDAGWHPTAVCGPLGAAVAACAALGIEPGPVRDSAVAIALLRAGGARGAFGSDGKAIQVGVAASAGVQAALAARAGARVDPAAVIHGPMGLLAMTGASWGVALGSRGPAIERNWCKLHPSCLGTHAPIDVAAVAADRGVRLGSDEVEIIVHPVARQAAHVERVEDPLAGKFSIPYCVAFTLLNGPPTVSDFFVLDEPALGGAHDVAVREDPRLPDFGAVLLAGGEEVARVPCPRGAPERPVSDEELAIKVASLAGDRLGGVLDDLGAPALAAWEAAGLPVSQ